VYHALVAVDADTTAANILGHPGESIAMFVAYLISLVGDVVLAWALFVLLAPVNGALSLLAAIFQLVYAAVAIAAAMDLLTALHALIGPAALQPQAHLLRDVPDQMGTSLLLFGVHLVLVGYLIVRSRYIPKLIGAWLLCAGVAWVVQSVRQLLVPDAPFGSCSSRWSARSRSCCGC
jgi:hypothetical protein